MNKEIGSEFWDIPIKKSCNKIFPSETRWFLSGRAALEQILEDIGKKKKIERAALPSWCCDCMITPFLKRKIDVVFYPVYWDKGNGLTCDYRNTAGCDISLKMHYFGYTAQKEIGRLSGIQIRDLTHSLFSGIPQDAEYYFGSLRKWAGFYTGGFAWGRWNDSENTSEVDSKYISMRARAMEEKKLYLTGQNDSKKYLQIFSAAEDYLDHCNIQGSCERDKNAALKLDDISICRTRRKNAQILLDVVADIAVFPDLKQADCPLFVPILLPEEKRNELKKFLICHQIYCPVHWPISELHHLNVQTEQIFNQELSLICDQRYGEADILREVEAIKVFMGW